MENAVRKSAVAGSWYPGHPETLTRDIRRYMDQATVPALPAKPVALVSPHAGYVYSGPVAGYAYKTLAGRTYARVVVISPSHRAAFPYISVWPEGGYQTPLGIIGIDTDFCRRLTAQTPSIQADRRPHLAEHALEIQLPFLQVVLGSFQLCPLIMGQQHLSLCTELAEALANTIDDRDDTLVVASSDLSHFHAAQRAAVMDQQVARLIGRFDIEGLSQVLETGASEACGGGPILSAMLYARQIGRQTAHVLRYADSGDITGDKSSVVGYLAAVLY